MKNMRIFIYSIVLSIACIIFINSFYDKKIHNEYFNKVGNLIEVEKNRGLVLQQEAVKEGDNVFIYGSSELSTVGHPFHPMEFFKNENRGFQVNLIGVGYCQSLIHAINFGAMGERLKDQKVVFIISPQWFDYQGETNEGFQGNFSQLQFLQFMFNDNINKNIKKNVAFRVAQLTSNNKEFYDTNIFCRLYVKDNVITNTVLNTLIPYYKIKYYVLSLKDKFKADKLLVANIKADGEKLAVSTKRSKENENIDWEKIKLEASKYGQNEANNNQFLMQNDYYNKYIKDKVKSFKDVYYKNASYDKSPEYNDLKILLEVCKNQDIKPLFVSIPVNGRWYDYGGFDRKDRQQYYSNINNIISYYKYPIADFSKYEYENYFLKDTMHLGWRGWVYVDEAIDKYYHAN